MQQTPETVPLATRRHQKRVMTQDSSAQNQPDKTFSLPEDEMIPTPTPTWIIYTSTVLGIVLIFGLVTWLLGLGPFAYRQIWYGTSEVYILNMTAQNVEVTLDKGQAITIGPESAERTPILGGTTRIVSRDATGEILEDLEVFVDGNPVLYNVQGERCMALSDVSGFYLPTQPKGIEILATFPKGTSLIPLPNDRIIWPRETLRDQVKNASAGVSWIELVSCPLLDPDDRHVLEAHLDIVLTERKKKEQELKKMREMREMMLRGGTEAIDESLGLGPKTKTKRQRRPGTPPPTSKLKMISPDKPTPTQAPKDPADPKTPKTQQ